MFCIELSEVKIWRGKGDGYAKPSQEELRGGEQEKRGLQTPHCFLNPPGHKTFKRNVGRPHRFYIFHN